MDSPSAPDSPDPATLARILDTMWTRFLPEILDRVKTLEAASAALASGSLSAVHWAEAESAAHKLAGTLGTFNLSRGTDISRELEVLFSRPGGPDRSTASQIAASITELRILIENRPASNPS